MKDFTRNHGTQGHNKATELGFCGTEKGVMSLCFKLLIFCRLIVSFIVASDQLANGATPTHFVRFPSAGLWLPSESSISNRPPRPNRCTEEAPWLLTFRRSPRPTQIMPGTTERLHRPPG